MNIIKILRKNSEIFVRQMNVGSLDKTKCSTKFLSHNFIVGIGVLPDKQEIEIKLDEYVANLGDLMNDFIDHKNKPFWKRRYYHNHLTKLYIEMLNQIQIIKGF